MRSSHACLVVTLTVSALTLVAPSRAQGIESPELSTTARGAPEVVAIDELALGKTVTGGQEPASASGQTTPAKVEQSTPPSSEPGVAEPLSSLPKQLPYKNEPEMPGYKLRERYRWWMIGTGAGAFVSGYILALAMGSDVGFEDGFEFTPAPLTGPWLTLAANDDECGGGGCPADTGSVLVASGILQDVGAILLTLAFVSPRTVWIREDLAVTVSPLTTQAGGAGLQARGTF